MQNGRYAEAEQIYREDLVRLPENGWSLYGLASSLRAQKKKLSEAAATRRKVQETLGQGGHQDHEFLPLPANSGSD
jgi:hypothetical protein